MGYTHYFSANRSFTTQEWDTLCEKVKAIIKHCKDIGIILQAEYNEPKPAKVLKTMIRFNGVEDDGHETFYLSKKKVGFNFCKTARKPYDLAVAMVLLACHEVAPDALEIGSDGRWNEYEWADARKQYKKLFGVTPKMPFAAVYMES